MNDTKLLSIGKTAQVLGVHVDTLREWDKEGKLNPVKTPGNHRRYKWNDIERFCGEAKEDKEDANAVAVITYARVSSHEQKAKGDLGRQNDRLLAYCAKKQYKVVKSYEEVGSGMCDTRPKLHQMFKVIENKEVDKVIVEHKDRLTRFNFNFLAAFFASHGVEIEWTEDVLGKSYEQELVEDMLTLMSSFSNRIYGKRSAEMKKRRKAEKEKSEGAEGLQNGTQPEQRPADAAAKERRGGKVGVQLGLEPEESRSRSQNQNTEQHRTSPPPERHQADRSAVDVRVQQVCGSRSPKKSGSSVQQLLDAKEETEGRVPEIQEQEERDRRVQADRQYQGTERPHPTSSSRHDPAQGKGLPSHGRQDTERHGGRESGSLVRECTGGDGTAAVHGQEGREGCSGCGLGDQNSGGRIRRHDVSEPKTAANPVKEIGTTPKISQPEGEGE